MYVCKQINKCYIFIYIYTLYTDLLGRIACTNLVERFNLIIVGGIDAAILRFLALQSLELQAALPSKELIFNNISGAWTWSKIDK